MDELIGTIRNLKESGHPDKDYINQLEIQLEQYDPLFIDNIKRLTLYPIQYPEIWSMYKDHQSTFWIAEEIDFSKDDAPWKNLKEEERYFLKHVLAFFASFDGIVNENLVTNFYNKVQNPEARSFYGFQLMIENIHSEVYSLLIAKFASDINEQNALLNAIETIPSIKNMAQWALKWAHADKPFNQRILIYTCIEGIMFSGPFCAIFFFKKRGLLHGLTFSNEQISKDEGLHMQFGVLMHHLQLNPATQETIHEITSEAVHLCSEFITESLPCSLIGMNATEMIKYIQYVADRLLVMLGCDKIWNSENPFPWMDLISTEVKTNFFERKVSQYAKSKIGDQSTDTNEFLEDY